MTSVMEHEKFAPTQYNPPTGLTFEMWEEDVTTALIMGKSIPWWIGDLLRLGEQRWGEQYAQAIDLTGLAYERLSDYKYVATQCSFRNERLSWTHHKIVAPLSPDKQQMWLDTAESEGWDSKTLRQEIARSKKQTDDEKPEVSEKIPNGKFMGCIIKYKVDAESDGLTVKGPEELLVALQNVVEG